MQTGGFSFSPAQPSAARMSLADTTNAPIRFIDGASLLPGDNGLALVAAGNVARQSSVQQGLQDVMLAIGNAGKAVRADKRQKVEDEKDALELAQKGALADLRKDEIRLRMRKLELGQPDAEGVIDVLDDLPSDFNPDQPKTGLSLIPAKTSAAAATRTRSLIELPEEPSSLETEDRRRNPLLRDVTPEQLVKPGVIELLRGSSLTSGKLPQDKGEEAEVGPKSWREGVWHRTTLGVERKWNGYAEVWRPDPKTKQMKLVTRTKLGKEPLEDDSGGDPKTLRQYRKEFLDSSKNFIIVRDAFKNMHRMSQDVSPAGDMGMVFSFMKLLDPTSTVRESEYANAAKAAGVPERLVAQINRVVNGQILGPSQRQDFLKQAETLYRNQEKAHAQQESVYSELAEKQGLDPKQVVVELRDSAVPALTAEVFSKEDYDALKPGTPYIWNGRQGIKK